MLKLVIDFVWLSDKHVKNQDDLMCNFLCVDKDAYSLCVVVFLWTFFKKKKNLRIHSIVEYL
jgi:hypothetical protein